MYYKFKIKTKFSNRYDNQWYMNMTRRSEIVINRREKEFLHEMTSQHVFEDLSATPADSLCLPCLQNTTRSDSPNHDFIDNNLTSLAENKEIMKLLSFFKNYGQLQRNLRSQKSSINSETLPPPVRFARRSQKNVSIDAFEKKWSNIFWLSGRISIEPW